ncbi:unnamed protein product [Rotaria sordida]|uniref:Uncharacterized protein n=1 Tax=Rotaria sordida TaxID=392033 RepID=A0A815Z6B4_9BILA|nr:unnamed protein product [Rotaria sordida]CAF1580273.1 unnamed protein product [Rotaria sordida]
MNCSNLTDPTHRFSYRHTGLSDYLIPCRNQQECRNLTSEHRKKYFHGEKINTLTVNQNIPKINFNRAKAIENQATTILTFPIVKRNGFIQPMFHKKEQPTVASSRKLSFCNGDACQTCYNQSFFTIYLIS